MRAGPNEVNTRLAPILQGSAKSKQKTASGVVEVQTNLNDTRTAASFPSYNPVQTLALSNVKDRAKAARMRAKAIKAVEEALRVVRGSDSRNMKYLVDKAEVDLQRIKGMPETSSLYQLIADTSTLNDHFSRLRLEASQLGLREAKMVAHRQNAVPADVERYVEEVRAANPDYDVAKIWATAWSIYCAYKNPDSEHCKKPTDEYFPGRSASDKALRDRLVKLAHSRPALRPYLLPLLSKTTSTKVAGRVVEDEYLGDHWEANVGGLVIQARRIKEADDLWETNPNAVDLTFKAAGREVSWLLDKTDLSSFKKEIKAMLDYLDSAKSY